MPLRHLEGEPVSVLALVVTREVTAWLPETLRAMARQTTALDRVVVAVWSPTALAAVREAVAEAGLAQADVVPAAGAATFGAAARTALRDHPAVRGQWLWLLHDDSAPAPDALAQQLRAVEQAASVVLVGAKQVEWDAPDELVSVGVGMTRSGRRFTALEEHEIDQGQYDDRSDVLAVAAAGALVRRDLWEALGGPDPAFGPYLDGADLARRARLAGHRVVVAPDALVRHARASYQGLRGARTEARRGGSRRDDGPDGGARLAPDPVRSWPARRRAVLTYRLVSATALGCVLAFLGMYLLAPVRALGRVATKEFGLIGAELRAPFAATARLGAIRRARARAGETAVLPRRTLRPLQVGLAERLATWRDARLHRAAVRRAARARSELEIAEAAALARRRRVALGFVLVATVGVALATVAPWIVGGALVGGGLLPLDVTLGDLWTLATSPWLATGDGHPGPAEPFFLVLATLTALLGGAWGTPVSAAITVLMAGAIPLAALGAWFASGAATRSLGVRAWVAGAWALMPTLLSSIADGRIGAVLAHLALPWVALGVARALGVQRRDVVLSGLVGAQRKHGDDDDPVAGRFGPAGVRAPAGAAGAAAPAGAAVSTTAAGRGDPGRGAVGSVGAAAAAGLAFAVACAGAPVLLPLGIAVILVLAIALPRARSGRTAGRARLVLVVLPALALLGPWLTAPFVSSSVPPSDALDRAVRLMLSEPGLVVAHDAVTGWQALAQWPAAPGALPGIGGGLASALPLVVGAPVLLGAVVALLRGGGRARAVRIGWLVTVVALAGALLMQLVPVGVAVDGATESATGAWPGPAVSVLLLGLLVSAAVAGDGLRGSLGSNAFGWRQTASGVLVAVLSVGPALGAAAWIWGVRAEPDLLAVTSRGAQPVPALGLQVQDSASAERVLSIVPTADGYDVQLWRSNGAQLVDGAISTHAIEGDLLAPTITGPDAAETSLAVAVSRLTVAADEAIPALVAHAVGVVVIPPIDSRIRPGVDATAAERLAAQLDGTGGLERVTTNDAGTIWRVVSDQGQARARVLGPDGAASDTTVLTSRDLPPGGLTSGLVRAGGELLAAGGERTLVLAERADAGWVATLDGAVLEPVTLDWRQAWILPPGSSGELMIEYTAPGRTPWAVGQLVVLGLAALLALPTRRRLPGEDL